MFAFCRLQMWVSQICMRIASALSFVEKFGVSAQYFFFIFFRERSFFDVFFYFFQFRILALSAPRVHTGSVRHLSCHCEGCRLSIAVVRHVFRNGERRRHACKFDISSHDNRRSIGKIQISSHSQSASTYLQKSWGCQRCQEHVVQSLRNVLVLPKARCIQNATLAFHFHSL